MTRIFEVGITSHSPLIVESKVQSHRSSSNESFQATRLWTWDIGLGTLQPGANDKQSFTLAVGGQQRELR